jgi:hypothetical protein
MAASHKGKNRQSIGFMDVDGTKLYCNESENTAVRIYDKASREEKCFDSGVLAHLIKLFDDYLIMVDAEDLYILEKQTHKIMARYQTKGEVTALCVRGEDSKKLMAFTRNGQLFTINTELKEATRRKFIEDD